MYTYLKRPQAPDLGQLVPCIDMRMFFLREKKKTQRISSKYFGYDYYYMLIGTLKSHSGVVVILISLFAIINHTPSSGRLLKLMLVHCP